MSEPLTVAGGLAAGRWGIAAGAAHLPYLEQPGAVVDLVREAMAG